VSRYIYFVDLEYNDAKIRFFDFKKTDINALKAPHKHWHTHIFYELHFSFENTVNFKFKEQTITLNPGELLIIPPSVMHESVDIISNAENYKVLSLEIEKMGTSEVFYSAFINAINDHALKPIKISDINKEAVFSFGNKELYNSLLGICQLKAYASEVIFSLFKKILHSKLHQNSGCLMCTKKQHPTGCC
jgi:methyltransferase-like protein